MWDTVFTFERRKNDMKATQNGETRIKKMPKPSNSVIPHSSFPSLVQPLETKSGFCPEQCLWNYITDTIDPDTTGKAGATFIGVHS